MSLRREVISGGTRCIVPKTQYYKSEGRGFEARWDELLLSVYLILPAALGPSVYQPVTEISIWSRKIMLRGSKVAAGAQGWQSHRHLWADCVDNVRSLPSHTPIGLHCLLRGYLYFLCVDDDGNSQETHLWSSAACYGDSFTFIDFQRSILQARCHHMAHRRILLNLTGDLGSSNMAEL
jgi:hypothetical protein